MEKNISIKVILDRLLRHPLMQDLSFETAVDYTVDFFGIIGMPRLFEERVTKVPVKNYRARIPCGETSITQIRETCSGRCLRGSTDNFHMAQGRDRIQDEPTFKVQGDYIYLNKREGELEVAYKAITTDEEGYPMIPEDPVILRALEYYIKKQWFTILFDMGKIQPAVLQNVQQEYAFYVGQAQNKLVMPTLSEMESITNMWNTLIPRFNEFRDGFEKSGEKERIRVQY